MKILKNLFLLLCLFPALSLFSQAQKDMKPRTVVIYHPAATDLDQFFAHSTYIDFEIHQPGSPKDVAKILDQIKSQPGVQNITTELTEDGRQVFHLVLANNMDKNWFMDLFKKAKLPAVSVNGQTPKPLDKI